MNKPFSITTFAILFGIFLISVALRWPNIDRPLSKHHEFTTAVALQVMLSWHENGISSVGYNPSMNFGNPGDKYLNNWANTTGDLVDDQGNFYYVSHPPLAYYIPYAIFKITGTTPNVLGLQLINMAFHFLSGLLIYFIICLLAWVKPLGKLYISALIGYCIFIFNSATMWFQGNTYMSDMLVFVPFIGGVFTLLKLLMRRRFYSPKYLFIYAVVLFVMVYTSWLGVFFAAAVTVYSLLKLRSSKVFGPLLTITLAMPVLALGLMAWQYAGINGFMPYVEQMQQRFGIRSSAGFSPVAYLKAIAKIMGYYVLHYAPIILLILPLIYLLLTRAKLRIVFTRNGYRFLWLSVLPVVLLHLVLTNYSGHDFTILYGALFFSVLAGILYDKLKYAATLSPKVLNFGVILACLLSVGLYYYVNRPGTYSWKGDRYAAAMERGERIKAEAKPNEVVFVSGFRLEPQALYYAKRNIKQIESQEAARAFLRTEHPLNQGVLFTFSPSGDWINTQRISTLE